MALYFHGEDVLQRPEIAKLLEGVTIRSWDEHEMRFTNAHGGVRKLTRKPSIFTLHWTGGTGDAAQVYRVLKNRKTRDGKGLSVQLFADHEGVLWQYADLGERCRHASATNKYGPGLEVQGRGIDRTSDHSQSIDEEIHGRKHTVIPFTPAQNRTILAVSRTIVTLFGIPARVPGNGSGPFPSVMTPREIRRFKGVLGHLHVSKHKLDPGLDIFRQLVGSGFEYTPIS